MARIVSRSDIGLGPWRNRRPFTVEASKRRGVVLHHDRADKALHIAPEREAAHLRAIQRWHQDHNGWSDTAYSHAVGQSGTLYELRGWSWDQFANGDRQEDWYTLLWIGGAEEPSPAAYRSILAYIDEARGRGAGPRVWPHNKIKAKPCPGEYLTAFAANWDGRPINIADMEEPTVWSHEQIEALVASYDGMRPGSPHAYAMQRALVLQGYDLGLAGVDGVPGDKTWAALNEWRRRFGWRVPDVAAFVDPRELRDMLTKPKPGPLFDGDCTEVEAKLAAARASITGLQDKVAGLRAELQHEQARIAAVKKSVGC